MSITATEVSYFNVHIFNRSPYSYTYTVVWLKNIILVTNFMTFYFHLVGSGLNLGTLGPVFSMPQFFCPRVWS